MKELAEALRQWRPRPWCQSVRINSFNEIWVTLGYTSVTGWALPEVKLRIASLDGEWGI